MGAIVVCSLPFRSPDIGPKVVLWGYVFQVFFTGFVAMYAALIALDRRYAAT